MITVPRLPERTFLPHFQDPEATGFKPWTAALPGMMVTKYPAACLCYKISTRPWCFFLIEAEMFLPYTVHTYRQGTAVTAKSLLWGSEAPVFQASATGHI